MILLFFIVRMLREVRAGVNEDRAQRRVVGRLAVQQQDAGLRGDGHPDLVIDYKPTAALEHFLVKKNKDVPLQLPLVRRREVPVDGEVRFQDFRPSVGEISLSNFLPMSFFKKTKHKRSLNQPLHSYACFKKEVYHLPLTFNSSSVLLPCLRRRPAISSCLYIRVLPPGTRSRSPCRVRLGHVGLN